MAVVLTPALAGAYCRTFTVVGEALDNGVNSAATAHGLVQAPASIKITDTTILGTTEGDCWTVHTVNATTFIVRKAMTTTEQRTALVTLIDTHSIERA